MKTLSEREYPKTSVVNVKKEDFDVYIGRASPGYLASPFCNPFKLGADGTREQVLAKFEEYFVKKLAGDPSLNLSFALLKGSRLGCWCKPQACHGDILARLLDGAPELSKPPQSSQFQLF